MMQMTMMTPPSFNNELHYLNKEDRLLRWILVKHRDVKFGRDFLNEDDGDTRMLRSSMYDVDSEEDEEDSDDHEEELALINSYAGSYKILKKGNHLLEFFVVCFCVMHLYHTNVALDICKVEGTLTPFGVSTRYI
ncbi:putative ribosomal protein S6 [Helianthus annuus]|nr:putative ribosomal protein S6 [Helianthus annuus]